MLYLYDKNTRDFTRNGTPLRDAYDAHVVREEGFYLKFKMLLNGQHKQLKKEMVVSAMTPSGYNQFRIFDINPQTDHVEVVALHLFYYLDNRLVRPFTLKDGSGVSAIRMFAANFVSDISPYTFDSSVDEKHDFQASTTETTDRDYLNALEVINRIGVRWDSEFELNGFDVRMIKRLGRRTNALLYEKKNIADFEEETTIQNLVTRIHAVSRWTLNNGDEGYIQDGDNDRELKVVVDSPLINEYSQIYEAEYVHNTARTEEELINWANLKYSTDNLDKPRRNIKVKTNIIDGTEINLGDELVLKYMIHDVDEVIRCVGYDYDPIGKSYYEITLGDWRQSFGNTVGKAVADVSERQKSQLETLQKHVQIVQMKADGIGRVTYGPNPIPNPQHGDLWYYYTLDRPNEVEVRVYDAEIGDWRKDGFDKDAFNQRLAEIDTQTQAMEEAIQANEAKARELFGTMERTTDLALEAHTLIKSIEDMRKEIESISDTAEIEPDFGQMYNKNRAEFGEAKIPLGTEKITVRHNGKGFEIGQTYTISFKADCIPHPSGGLTLILDRRMDLPTKVRLIPRTKGLPTIDDTLTVNTKTLASVYDSVYDFVFENDWAYLASEFTKIAGDQTINRTLNWKTIADGNEHIYTGEWSEAPELILDGGMN